MRPYRSFSIALLLTLAAGCSGSQDGENTEDELNDSDKVRWADAKSLSLDDLSRVVAKYASDGFNDALAGDVGAAVEVKAFGKTAEPNRVLPNRAEVGGIDQIVQRLEQRLGGTELGTRLNKTRLANIEAGRASHYVESAFKFRAGIGHDWSFQAGGVTDGNATLGLHAGTELESRVVLATDNAGLDAMVQTPLAAAKGLRGFVAPRSLEDVRKMAPGESFALRGGGRLATNLGLGVPVFAAGAGGLGYEVVVSAGVAAVFDGRLDVQLVRMEGDEVVVDVGIDNVKSFKVHAALEDGFGIKGVCEDGEPCLRDKVLGGQSTKLGELVEKAVTRRLNEHLKTRVAISYEKESSRIGLTRMTFHLDRGNPAEIERALQQALKFDLRLAEALSNRDLGEARAGVVVDFDAVRSSTTSTLDFGFQLAGIDIYDRTVVKQQGSFVFQSPEGATLLSYDALDKQRKLFQTTHGVSRIGIGARTIDARNPSAWRSEANLFVRARYSDKHIHDDRFVDGLDALIASVGGADKLAALDPAGSALEQRIRSECPLQAQPENPGQFLPYDDACNVRLLGDASFIATRDGGLQAFAQATRTIPEDFQKLLNEAAAQRLALQSVFVEGNAGAREGISMSLQVDQRFDDKALDILTKRSGAEYRTALRDYLAVLTVKRADLATTATREGVRAALDSKHGKKLDRMTQKFVEGAGNYRKLATAEAELVKLLEGKRHIASPIGVRFETNRDGARDEGKALMTSTSHERAQALTQLFDKLVDTADDADIEISLYDQHTALFPLVALVPAKNLKVGLALVTSGLDDDKITARERFRQAGIKNVTASAAGAEVAPITLGNFDVETALTGK